jgi:hypothetical protein
LELTNQTPSHCIKQKLKKEKNRKKEKKTKRKKEERTEEEEEEEAIPHNRPWRPIVLSDVKDPTLSRQSAHS